MRLRDKQDWMITFWQCACSRPDTHYSTGLPGVPTTIWQHRIYTYKICAWKKIRTAKNTTTKNVTSYQSQRSNRPPRPHCGGHESFCCLRHVTSPPSSHRARSSSAAAPRRAPRLCDAWFPAPEYRWLNSVSWQRSLRRICKQYIHACSLTVCVWSPKTAHPSTYTTDRLTIWFFGIFTSLNIVFWHICRVEPIIMLFWRQSCCGIW